MEKNNNLMRIAPSILSADFSKMGEEVISIQNSGADLIHADVMDGIFVPNITFGPKMIADIKNHTTIPIDTHLMIVEPWKYIERFALAGSAYITVHYEACGNRTVDTLKAIKSLGVKCGVVINPDTELEPAFDSILESDMLLLMSVNPGFGGQEYIEKVTDKIKQARKFIDKNNSNILLEVDGGVNFENVAKIKHAGANVIVSGNTIFKADDRSIAIELLRNL